MSVDRVGIGDYQIWFNVTAYNPIDVVSDMYCEFLTGWIKEKAGLLTLDEVHDWIRKNRPEFAEVLKNIEDGNTPIRQVPIGSFPFTPGQEKEEAPIIGHLKLRRLRRGDK